MSVRVGTGVGIEVGAGRLNICLFRISVAGGGGTMTVPGFVGFTCVGIYKAVGVG